MIEIEKRFLIQSPWGESHSYTLIEQGYLFIEKNRSLRVRRHNEDYFLTLKIEKSKNERFEFESKIKEKEGNLLLKKHCISNIISKTRNIIYHDNIRWEIDVFKGENENLIVAEVELSSANNEFTTPSWLGPEVTMQNRYLNSHLSQKPFSEWGITYKNLLLEESRKNKETTSQ